MNADTRCLQLYLRLSAFISGSKSSAEVKRSESAAEIRFIRGPKIKTGARFLNERRLD
jgi:hypothetical protein